MGIIPCEIPLLEFDPEQTAVIGPDYEQLDLHLPRKCVFAFLGGYIDRYAHAAGARQVATFNSATRLYPIYVTTYHGQEVVLCQAPVGADAAAQLLDWLISYGVREITSVGSCGVLRAHSWTVRSSKAIPTRSSKRWPSTATARAPRTD